MTSRELAAQFGYLVALFGVGAVGLVCLITGLRARSRARRRRRVVSATPLIIVGVVMLNLGGLGIAGSLVKAYYLSPFDTDKSMRVGQCVDQNTFLATRFGSYPGNSCANPVNTYELAFRGAPSATCPDGKRDRSIYNRYTDNYTIMCFALNLKQGRCYQLANGAETLTMTLGDCGKPQPMQAKVVQRIDGSTDTTRCRPEDRSIAYPAPPRVYCLAPTGS
ncbi:hypothetical protein [Mycobacterium terramassiliense]|uniref:hypothetical protein n=1 Tax=Mycobacterium terramassiliense TaxID=1841859 RepID=UPI0012FF93F3|nr:hypothetical protein [Mycobacterium terramassiliense]